MRPTSILAALAAVLSVLLPAGVRAGDLVLGDGGIVFADGSVQTTAATVRRFYATVDLFSGASALDACDPGFHMASVWELVSLAGLRYDTTRGFTDDDSGEGLATLALGWLRTGRRSSSNNVAGSANCNVWTSNSDSSFGTRGAVTTSSSSATVPGSQWLLSSVGCNTNNRVWCIED